jgi:tetratricopeptide (TPR) repeat protein
MDFLPILVAIIVVVGFVAVLMAFSGSKKGSNQGKKKSRQNIIKDATRKLSQNPHNPDGLIPLASLYYQEELWEKAYSLYDTMLNIAVAHPQIDLGQAALRQGICALKIGKTEDAFRGLLQARKINPDNFETNFYLGQACINNKEYDKAIPLLRKALMVNKEVPEIYKYLGLALYHNHNFKESLPYLKRALDVSPDDKELLFSMADAMKEGGNGDRAIKVFMHLRPDPEFGARACLAAGLIHQNAKQNDKAVQDFEIGLKHINAPIEILTQIRYRLAHAYLETSDIGKALICLKDIQSTVPNYKDVPALIARYQELNQNSNLHTYLISNNSDFIALCRKIVSVYFGKAYVKVLDINAMSDCTEVQTEIETAKWEDSVLFRFYRTTGSVGELFIRDFHARIKDLKSGRGICFTAGTFTEEARKYIEGRPIDLTDKAGLIKILNRIDTKPSLF